MTLAQIDKTKTAWPAIAETLHVPHTEKDYRELVAFLDKLVDEVGENEGHPLASLMEVIGVLIEKYEDEHVPQLKS
jgi:HTH-type transcriptional regulator / antitoxin HigA